ncbi:MAG: cysteine--tRNA ligase, partial [Rikenellaceae bacterium]|nr:cysteine--tRNA ligase [Rikenellaceae bacterium]
LDIHGGGMDLMFPHHECEIAQSTASMGHEAVRYWMHNNMITIDGRKMGKSLGNFITLEELFSGDNELLDKAYSPMTIRFFILQAHYRSTLDFSSEALSAAEKGLERLMNAMAVLEKIKPSDKSTVDVSGLKDECMESLCDDLNSPVAIATLFEWVKVVNQLHDGSQTLTADDLASLKDQFCFVVTDLLGLTPEVEKNDEELIGGLISMILEVRQQAKEAKNWAVSDKIRDELARLGVTVKDRKDGADWEIR